MLVYLLAGACLLACGITSIATAQQPVAPPLQPDSVVAAAAGQSLAGDWSGGIQLPGMELKIEVSFAGEAGAWTGKIDIPMQGAKGLPLQKITVDGETLSFQIANIPGEPTFRGARDGADKITGNFTQGGQVFAFQLSRGALAKAKRPQNPVPPLPYSEEKVSVANGNVTLAGTLTIPQGKGPFPAVILVSGSGPQNRDEEIFEHRPFAVWADHLSRNGIAVVRYDDRGVGESTGVHAVATTTILGTDAESWVGFLKARPEVSTVGIMGHSEGGIIAPMVAARNPDVAFIVMLAGTGVSGAEVLVEQNRSIAIASGATPETAEKIAAAARAVFEAIAKSADMDTIRARMTELVLAQTGKVAADADVQQAASQAMMGLEQPWFREFIRHDPAADLRKVTVPVLAIFGERDVQVVPVQNVPSVEAALQAAGNTRATIRVIPGVNHMFQPCTTGSVAEYEKIETTVDPAVLELVRDWMKAQIAKAG